MSKCIRHEACPKCGPVQDGSGDNLGVYDDGHKWCFACGYYVHASGVVSLQDMRARLSARHSVLEGMPMRLPEDHTYTLPEYALEWLRQYELTDAELAHYKVGWSEISQRIIFPVYDKEANLLMWQGRYCPNPDRPMLKRPKYFTQGSGENTLAIFGPSLNTAICLVEDVVSAIKVGRVVPTLCLWGSEVSMTRIKRLALLYTNILLWLDYDKAGYSARCEIKARPYFTQVSAIYTQKDPKAYSTEEIAQWTNRNAA